MKTRSVVSAVLLAVACSEPTAVSDGVLVVTAGPSALQLQNVTQAPVNYFVVERNTAALINWAACAGPDCPAVPANTSVNVPYAQIGGYAAGTTEVIVYWWRSVADGAGGFRPDSIRGLVAPL